MKWFHDFMNNSSDFQYCKSDCRPGKSVILLFHMGTCSVLSTDCRVVPEARHGYSAMPGVAVM